MKRTKRKADLLSQSASPGNNTSPLAADPHAVGAIVAVEELFRNASREYAKVCFLLLPKHHYCFCFLPLWPPVWVYGMCACLMCVRSCARWNWLVAVTQQCFWGQLVDFFVVCQTCLCDVAGPLLMVLHDMCAHVTAIAACCSRFVRLRGLFSRVFSHLFDPPTIAHRVTPLPTGPRCSNCLPRSSKATQEATWWPGSRPWRAVLQ
jgi:hypothetical protein